VACVRWVLGEMPKGLGHDANATSRGRRTQRGRGGGMAQHGEARHGSASWRGCAHTRTGPGFLGPRCGHAVRGAPASRARDTTRRRKATAATGSSGGAAASCTRAAQGRMGEGVLRSG
jgi:hypothetical protein